ncbi:MAG: hypothetical protein KGL39_38895 [Patescibacteria group bacterium]|nr:hypothetical protein [Patescibacteria group bacterium]
MTAPNFCTLTGTTIINGVPTAGVPFSFRITALPTTSPIPAGNMIGATIRGLSGTGGLISVEAPQGASYTIRINSGNPTPGEVPYASDGLLVASFG